MQLGLAIAIALLIIAVVAWPLAMRRRSASPESDTESSSAFEADGGAALNDVYDAIRTLQTEYRLGRVADDDYQEQLDEYRRQAARILRDMDRETRETQDD